MIANSLPLTSSLFGNSSGISAASINSTTVKTIEDLLLQQVVPKLNVKLPRVPSNQQVARDTVGGVSSIISQTFIVTTVPNPIGSGSIFAIDGVNTPILSFVRNGYYIFDQSDVTNIGHPLKFKNDAGSLYETGVKISGIPGQIGARTVIVIKYTTPNSLRYFCTVHGNGMGNTIIVIDGVSSGGGDSLPPSGGGSSGGGSGGGGSGGGGYGGY